MRAFIAIDLPSETRDAIAALQRRLKATGVAASWVKPENFHLTLRFLGDISEEQAAELTAVLAPVCANCHPVTLAFQGAGAFPSLRKPGVLWAGLTVLEGDLLALRNAAEAAAKCLGLAPERQRFQPHVTIARVRDHRRLGACLAELARCASLGADAFLVRSVSLWRSQLHPGGSIYHPVQEFPLSCS